MKRYLFACIAAMSVGAMVFAGSEKETEAFVYEIQLLLKTTGAKTGKIKVSDGLCDLSGKTIYRAKRTAKVKGLVWGATCGSWDGAVFWDETGKYQYEAEFSWEFLNRIGAKARESEGLWRLLMYCEGEQIGELIGAGFGELSGSKIKSMKGDFAGWMHGEEKIEVEKIECRACSKGSVNVYVSVAWDACGCDELDEERTAAHGDWSLKKNDKAAAKLEAGASIGEAYSFPKYVTP